MRPELIVFDVNETLLDLAPLKSSVSRALGGNEALVPLWFSTMLHYSLVETISGTYHPFEEIGAAALVMVAKTHDIEIDLEEARDVVSAKLRPHPDVADALAQLADAGFRLVSLTNSATDGAEAQLKNAGLSARFEERYSIDAVEKYKPHPDAYRMVIDALGVAPEATLMVAAHAWDLAGAKAVGLRTAFVARPGKALYPNAATPDYVVRDLLELVRRLESKS